MVPYNYDKHAQLPQWNTGNMNALVVLDQPGNNIFTNLDQISGKVFVKCGKSVDIDSIVVKLEGESRTRLMAGVGPNIEKPKPQLEYHKILYRVQMVFPPADILEGRGQMAGKSAYTLPPGTHEYKFSFKLPFNNSCATEKQTSTMSLSGGGLEVAKAPTRHVKKTLPPTMSGFPGEAEIRYYVKATVTRHSFWKENPRAFTPFNFIPIEPPRGRPRSSGNEVFARQKHTFSPYPDADGAKSKIKGMFGPKEKVGSFSSPTTNKASQVSIDARLPEPPILTCNKSIPLRLIAKKLDSNNHMVYLQSLQISLIGSTQIRAHEVWRTEHKSWIIISKSNMGIAIGAASDPMGTETLLDDSLWREHLLPNTVAPSFQTCNIERFYKLDVRLGLSCSGVEMNASKSQTIVLPLRLNVQVFSGIAPPHELLEAMAQARANLRRRSTVDTTHAMDTKLRTEGRTGSPPPTPFSANGEPAQAGESAAAQQPPQYSDAPPSYEDAIATDLPPVETSRPDYAPTTNGEDDMLRRDEKRGFLNRRDS